MFLALLSMMRLNAKWESLLHLMRKTNLLMPTDPTSQLQQAQSEHARREAAKGGRIHSSDLPSDRLKSVEGPEADQDLFTQILRSSLNSDLNRLVMDYLVIEGYKDAADSFSMESGLKPFVDSDSILNRMIIRGAIQRGDVDDAIGRVNELDPEVRFDFIDSSKDSSARFLRGSDGVDTPFGPSSRPLRMMTIFFMHHA